MKDGSTHNRTTLNKYRNSELITYFDTNPPFETFRVNVALVYKELSGPVFQDRRVQGEMLCMIFFAVCVGGAGIGAWTLFEVFYGASVLCYIIISSSTSRTLGVKNRSQHWTKIVIVLVKVINCRSDSSFSRHAYA